MTMRPQFVIANNGGRNDFDDEQSVRDRHWHPCNGEQVIDIGSAIGSYTLPALAAGANVFAVAADPDTRAVLLANVDANPGFSDRLTVGLDGAYDQAGWMTLYAAHDFSKEKPMDTPCFYVRPLDEIVEDIGLKRVDWIKVDVEGAEVNVLRGAERTIRKHRPRVLVENHLFMNRNLETAVIQLVESFDLGYSWTATPYNELSHTFFETPRRVVIDEGEWAFG